MFDFAEFTEARYYTMDEGFMQFPADLSQIPDAISILFLLKPSGKLLDMLLCADPSSGMAIHLVLSHPKKNEISSIKWFIFGNEKDARKFYRKWKTKYLKEETRESNL